MNLHVLMLGVAEGLFNAELKRLSSDSQIIDVIVFEFYFAHLLFFCVD